MSDTLLTDCSFADTGLHPQLVTALEALGFTRCSHIQSKVIPLLVSHRDVQGQSQTGTGKTLAFLAGIFHHLILDREEERLGQRNYTKALVIAPTRELAKQIYSDAVAVNRSLGFRVGIVFGGEDLDAQARRLKDGNDLLIATPGRVIDFWRSHVVHFSRIRYVVLDEADRMFDLGFIKDIRFIFRHLPSPDRRLSMLFSATLSYRVQELAYEHMDDPVSVSATEENHVTADSVSEEMFYPSQEDKIPLLLTLIEEEWPDKAMIFTNTRHAAEEVAAYLEADELRAGLLIGSMPQSARNRTVKAFMDGELDFLVATDVASRGLHFPNVSHVFNYDLPEDPEDYVHRIGRTGRAGSTGCAISFACEKYVGNLEKIEEYIRHKIPASEYDGDSLIRDIPEVKEIRRYEEPRRHSSGRGSGRGSERSRRPGGPSGGASRSGSGRRTRPSGGRGGRRSHGRG
ncbi:MAG: DEAD/DEAH box helicase [Succinivibrionaceae bacterium]|nr:DEAD/DEAH box helicase [Succinivibrionaceae bacterium]